MKNPPIVMLSTASGRTSRSRLTEIAPIVSGSTAIAAAPIDRGARAKQRHPAERQGEQQDEKSEQKDHPGQCAREPLSPFVGKAVEQPVLRDIAHQHEEQPAGRKNSPDPDQGRESSPGDNRGDKHAGQPAQQGRRPQTIAAHLTDRAVKVVAADDCEAQPQRPAGDRQNSRQNEHRL